MTKILLVSHIFPPAVDGGSRVIYKLGKYFESQNCQTLYLSSDCSSTDDFTKNKFKKSRILNHESRIYLSVYHHLHRPFKLINLFLPKKSYLYQFLKVCQKGPIFKFFPFVKATIKIIKFHPNLIIVGPLPTTIILYAKLLKTIINLYYHLASFPSFLQRRESRSGFCRLLINASFHQTDQDFFQKPLIKTLQQTDYLWTLTQYESDFFTKNLNINPQKIILAGNGVEQSLLKNNQSVVNKIPLLKGETGLSGKGFIILFIGSLSAHKGLDTLINSFSLLLKANSYSLPTKLILAGQKTLYFPEILKIIHSQPSPVQKNIHFIFNFPQRRLSHLIDQSNILVLPSNQESFGLVLIEAWARHKPVITSDIPPLKELVHQTRGGLTFKNKNSTDLQKKLIELINSPQKRNQLGQNGFNYVKNNYTWPIVGKKISQKIIE